MERRRLACPQENVLHPPALTIPPMLSLLILSLSVAADATAVAIAASVRGITSKRGLLMAVAFGLAQSIMAAIGWTFGELFGESWKAWDHWIALALLSGVGLKMIKEAFEDSDEDVPLHGAGTLLTRALATSLDALAVGVTLPTVTTTPITALALMGGVTLVCSALGIAFGRFLGERFGRVIEVAGGITLILIGANIVREHLA